jgi:uncharacterized protein (DUF1330 family)
LIDMSSSPASSNNAAAATSHPRTPSSVDPTGASLKRFLIGTDGEKDDGPFVMLNLLRFAPEGGRELYARYAAAVEPLTRAAGASIVYAGDMLPPALVAPQSDTKWDAVLLVSYPSRASFLRMIADPDYKKASKLRTAALEQAVLHPTTRWTLKAKL